jgi:hypothetical protein
MQIGPLVIEHPPLRHMASRVRIVVGEHRARRRASREMPGPWPWDMVEPRIVPLLAGPYLDRPGEGLVRTTSALGCAIVFGVDLAGAMGLVDTRVAERWERSADDLYRAGMANLRRRAARVLPKAVVGGTMSGRAFRRVLAPRGFASSLALVPNELSRLLGDGPLILAAPTRELLLAFSPDIPIRVIAGIAIEFESRYPYPLMIDPFLLEDGRIEWQLDREDALGDSD